MALRLEVIVEAMRRDHPADNAKIVAALDIWGRSDVHQEQTATGFPSGKLRDAGITAR